MHVSIIQIYRNALPESKLPDYKKKYLAYASQRNDPPEMAENENDLMERKAEIVSKARNCGWSMQVIEDLLDAGSIFGNVFQNIVCAFF